MKELLLCNLETTIAMLKHKALNQITDERCESMCSMIFPEEEKALSQEITELVKRVYAHFGGGFPLLK